MENKSLKIKIDDMPRLRWNCRRGMLELDIILLNFLEKGYPQLNDEQKQCFIDLLGCNDQALFAWLIHAEPCPEVNKSSLITIIRQHAKDHSRA